MSAPPSIDTAHVRRRFHSAAGTYGDAAALQTEVGKRLLERFDVMRIAPSTILDVGCGPGTHTSLLVNRFPNAQVIALDHVEAMVSVAAPAKRGLLERFSRARRASGLCGDMSHLPLKHGAIDVLWSNFSLQWANDLPSLFKEWNRALRTDAVLMFTAPGPDTLIELRTALSYTEGNAVTRAHAFTDLHDLGDMLIHAGFADPVMDMEVITLEYSNAKAFWRDLREQGAISSLETRPRGLMTPRKLARIEATLERSRGSNGKIRVSVEVVYGHAWKAPPKKTAEGHGIVRIDAIRRSQTNRT
jgi:malonyl-CoA O-methyltransferase